MSWPESRVWLHALLLLRRLWLIVILIVRRESCRKIACNGFVASIHGLLDHHQALLDQAFECDDNGVAGIFLEELKELLLGLCVAAQKQGNPTQYRFVLGLPCNLLQGNQVADAVHDAKSAYKQRFLTPAERSNSARSRFCRKTSRSQGIPSRQPAK